MLRTGCRHDTHRASTLWNGARALHAPPSARRCRGRWWRRMRLTRVKRCRCACIALLLAPSSRRGNSSEDELDELDDRERRDHAYAHSRAFQILLAALILANVYLIAARARSWSMPDNVDLMDLLGALVVGALALTGTVLAWQAADALGGEGGCAIRDG